MRKATIAIVILCSILSLQNCKRDYNSSNEDIIEPNGTNTDANPKPKLESVNFYLENSLSMNGYGGTNTNFTNAVTTLLSEIEQKAVPEDSIKLNVIANDRHRIDDQVYDFNKKLTLNGIPAIGEQSWSNLNEMFQIALNETSENQISILVTDAIYSVKIDGQDSNCESLIGLLEAESKRTKSVFSKYLKTTDRSTLILKMNSQFDGMYYPAQGGEIRINQDRPYYIWFFGDSYNLKELYNKLELNNLSGYTNDLFILKANTAKIDYSILEYGEGVLGDFENLNFREYPIHSIGYNGVDKFNKPEGQFGFSVALDLSEVPLPDQYLSEIDNYRISSSEYEIYRLESIADRNLNDKTMDAVAAIESRTDSKFTHVIFVKTNQQYIQSFNIALKNKLSEWIQLTGLDCDNKIKDDTDRTFGFDRLAKGILKAYTEIDPEQKHFEIKLTVTKS